MTVSAITPDHQDIATRLPEDILSGRSNYPSDQETAQQSSEPEYDQQASDSSAEDISLQKLHHVTDAVDSYMSSMGVDLKYHVDEQTDIVQVEVRDPHSDKLIRKIPADDMLKLAASIENMVGLFLDKQL